MRKAGALCGARKQLSVLTLLPPPVAAQAFSCLNISLQQSAWHSLLSFTTTPARRVLLESLPQIQFCPPHLTRPPQGGLVLPASKLGLSSSPGWTLPTPKEPLPTTTTGDYRTTVNQLKSWVSAQNHILVAVGSPT